MPAPASKPTPRWRRSLLIDAAQGFVRWFFRMSLLILLRVRVHLVGKIPAQGPVVLLSNHQSNFDPLILGSISPTPINYLSKKSLFEFPPLGWFFLWNDCIPIDRENNAIAGIKETLRRLKQKEVVLIFPEGSRSPDGKLQPIKQGFCTMARRTKSQLLPVAIDGAWQASNAHVVIGDLIPFEDYQDLSDEQMAALVEEKIVALYTEARKRRDSSLNIA